MSRRFYQMEVLYYPHIWVGEYLKCPACGKIFRTNRSHFIRIPKEMYARYA